ncbi:MAG: type IV toxin-antitoxin system AbiEi family antitoxin [Parachlamydiales bacterium]
MQGNSRLPLELLRTLVREGSTLFTIDQARQIIIRLGGRPAVVHDVLRNLKRDHWIRTLKRGLYVITEESGFGPVPHEYQVATALVHPSAIAYWSALQYHHMTQQIPSIVFVLMPTSVAMPRQVPDPHIRFVRTKEEHYFGIENVWVGEYRVPMTDPERTLLDGLVRPDLCGDIQEVLHAFKMRGEKLQLDRIIDYALRLGGAVAKRLGYILEKLGYSDRDLRPLLELPIRGIRKLDAKGPASGPISSKWKIQQNIGGSYADLAQTS